MATETHKQVFEKGTEAAADVLDQAKEKESQVLSAVDKMQGVIGKVTPVPTTFDPVTAPSDIKARLDWGEPAFSLVDVRDRQEFNYERITGAMPMPMAQLINSAKAAFESTRDIYLYGDSENNAADAANQLRSLGFQNVSTIKGGLAAWKAIGGPVEGQKQMSSTQGQLLP